MKRLMITILTVLVCMTGFAQNNKNQAELNLPEVYRDANIVFWQLDDHTWIGSGNKVSSETVYIIEGTERAILIDAGTSIPDLDKIVKGITDKPVSLFLTHMHGDHVGAAHLFDEIWVNITDQSAVDNFRKQKNYSGKVSHINNGQRFDLGGRTIEAFYTPGHTAGCTTFLEVGTERGFSGDAFGNTNLLVGTDFATLLNTCNESLKYFRENGYTHFYNGHFWGDNLETLERIEEIRDISLAVLKGELDGEESGNGMMGLNRIIRKGELRVNYSDKNIEQERFDYISKFIVEMGATDNQTMTYVDILSNRFGGRLIGSDAYDNAAEWCAHMFEKWGLEVWMQEVGELPVGFNRGPWFGRMLGGDGKTLHFATPSYTVGTKGVQRGHVLKEPKTQAEFNRMKEELNGAWVLITGKSDGFAIDWSEKGDSVRNAIIAENAEIDRQNREINAYNRNLKKGQQPKELLKRKDAPALFYDQMVEAGILGIIQSSTIPIRALYDRKNINTMSFDNLAPVPDIKLNEDQYAEIEKMVERREYFQLEFDIRNHFKMGPVKYHNVIGVIRGTEYPDEYVLAGGHLDAYDVATGGVDCSSGIAPVMEAARMIAESGGKPKRSILFCLWAGEEFGLLGSKFFVENNTVDLEKISNYFNRDSTPFVPTGINVNEAMYEDFVKVCAPLADAHPEFTFTVGKNQGPARPRPTSAGGSDHAYFAMNGVPTVSFNITDPKGYNFDYNEIWHTERDTYNKSIPEYQDHAATCTAVVLFGLANLDHVLDRTGLYAD